jgi:hypothetical protein
MPRTCNIDNIRAELAWVNETPDPNKCGCRNLRCCEETTHKPGACAGAVATKFWTFRWEYYCTPCREYGWCGSKKRGYMTDDYAAMHQSDHLCSPLFTTRLFE